MKKFSYLLSIFLLVLVSCSLVSCEVDDDTGISYTLEGTWKGNMYVSSQYDGVTYDALYSEISFSRNPYTYASGTGFWLDVYKTAPWGRNYIANHIDWRVVNSTLEIHFVEEGTTIWIQDYRLSDNRFIGTIYDGANYVDFDLIHVSSPNWYDYEYGFAYGPSYMVRATDGIGKGKVESPKRIFRIVKK